MEALSASSSISKSGSLIFSSPIRAGLLFNQSRRFFKISLFFLITKTTGCFRFFSIFNAPCLACSMLKSYSLKVKVTTRFIDLSEYKPTPIFEYRKVAIFFSSPMNPSLILC